LTHDPVIVAVLADLSAGVDSGCRSVASLDVLPDGADSKMTGSHAVTLFAEMIED
jgi:hypothetical protein